ncbi:hypothetical protein N9N28_16055 [Rubripirellula amarantea]|nr:hypothetical protein [Rubripirellula amarantea]
MTSPYDPPVADAEQSSANNCPPLVRVGVSVFGLLQLGIGWISFTALASYILDTNANPSRYQLLIVPIFMWIFSIPVLLASVFVYRRARQSITMLETLWFNGTSLLPTLGLACVFLTPLVAK